MADSIFNLTLRRKDGTDVPFQAVRTDAGFAVPAEFEIADGDVVFTVISANVVRELRVEGEHRVFRLSHAGFYFGNPQ